MGSSSLDCDRRQPGAVRGARKVGGRGNAQGSGSKGRTTAPGKRKAAPPARALEEATAEAASSAPTQKAQRANQSTTKRIVCRGRHICKVWVFPVNPCSIAATLLSISAQLCCARQAHCLVFDTETSGFVGSVLNLGWILAGASGNELVSYGKLWKLPQGSHSNPCPWHTAHSILHIPHSTLHTTHRTPRTAHRTPRTAHRTPHAVRCTLHRVPCTVYVYRVQHTHATPTLRQASASIEERWRSTRSESI